LVTIEVPTESSSYSTQSEMLRISGSRSIDVYAVNWTNTAGGSGGAFLSHQEQCFFFSVGPFPCNHEWDASIPLAVGENVITVTGSGANGNWGRDTITVVRQLETTPPRVSSASPSSGATGIAPNAAISAHFSEPMDTTTVSTVSFQLKDPGGNAIGGTISNISNVAQFSPAEPLAFATTYSATITRDVRDLAGNAMAVPFTWTFTTGAAPDITPPAVTATSPDNGATCVAIDSRVTVSFDEPINGTTVNSDTFTLNDAHQGTTIDATISILSDRSFALTPRDALPHSSYVAALGAGVRDLSGNATGANLAWTFATPPGGLGSWQATSTSQISSASSHTAVWTGTEMLVWGATTGQFYSSVGRRYQPNTDTWTPINGVGAPAARIDHVAVWTGSRMIIWGGSDHNGAQRGARGDGSLYDPITDAWQPMSPTNAPAPRTRATAIWTGTEMLVWGGMGGNGYFLPEAIGGRYNPATDTWQPMSNVDAPPAMYGHTAIWTGSKMIVWGGSTNLSASGSSMGGAYDPATDTWELTPTLGAPSGRSLHTAVWTGTEMAIWGGRTLAGAVNSGGMYDPQSKAWRPISDTCGAAERFDHTAVWTGGEMIIWGGSRNGALVTSGAQYNPTTDAWQHVSLAGAPAKRLKHSAIWTGAAMIIWGGQDSLGALKSGGRYQP
jgi:hypothetical protein